MNTTKPGSILRHIHFLVAKERTDEELLRAFVEGRDESAFTALVRRHGPLVLRVCQCALQHRQDAEDAFQATFLLLARKAAMVRKGQSLANWLHGVAYRLTMQVKRNAARRRAREKEVKAMPRRSPCEQLMWREVETILHEEVGRLPAKCRDVFVLCGLNGVSRVDAARELGLAEGTLSSRLAQARKLLQARLGRRGVSLACVLGIAALSRRAGAAVHSPLLRATVELALSQTAAGAATACKAAGRIVTLIQGVEQSMSMSKLKVVMLFLVITTLVTVGQGVVADPSLALPAETSMPVSSAPQGQRRSQAASQPRADTAPIRQAKTVTLKGRVLGPDGKAFAGAKLYFGHYGRTDDVALAQRATSNAEGRFEFTFTRSELSKAHPDQPIAWAEGMYTFERFNPPGDPAFSPVGQVVAVGDGLGCDWARIDPAAAGTELTFRLVKDVPVSGRILDEAGKPVAGAKVRVGSVQAYPGEDLTEVLEKLRKSNEFPGAAKHWGGPFPGQAQVVTTGEDGRFHMAGFGGERLVTFHVEGPGIEYTNFRVMTRAGDPVVGPEGKVNLAMGNTITVVPAKLYGSTFRYLAAASRPIRGVVTDKETGKPLADVVIRVRADQGLLPGSGAMLTTRTDQDGRYELLGCPKSSAYHLVAQPADTGRYFAVIVGVADTPGLTPLMADIKLLPGIVVRGTVRDERTGKPIPGAKVHYYPLNPNAASRDLEDYAWTESAAITGADGSFAVAALPGLGILGAVAPDAKSYTRRAIGPKELEAFFKKFNAALEEGNTDEFLVINVGPLTRSVLLQRAYNTLALIHPDEKQKELTQDLVLRRP
jgi:RNA polymerase sigma factor (sigma-70 family)